MIRTQQYPESSMKQYRAAQTRCAVRGKGRGGGSVKMFEISPLCVWVINVRNHQITNYYCRTTQCYETSVINTQKQE